MSPKNKQYFIECDEDCGTSTIAAFGRKLSMEEFRSGGWKIGKKCICPDCYLGLKTTEGNQNG